MVESTTGTEKPNKSEGLDFAKFAQLLNNKVDPKLKFNILNMIDTRQISKVGEMDPVKNNFTEEKLMKFLEPDDEFCEENNLDYMICDNFFDEILQLPEEQISALLGGCR